ncbi:hypothetical protein IDSA_04785 [Pseudidiomarina salinarum]|uniref:DUF3080 domain-containing protein n=1 Tax=Pseudidiomarina salinarum TaxID=435908 RepID=A0A094IY19_9GAMM|nr:DUF3080 family protein [Pseudidiomarina salinarum]KFZ31997.1 hypothetical protein IDSA_04785 [Pseudidiomarina salinarum]RUO70226.1 DUF3080 domain-containing protein [Pseudidiomarina salinarum]
MIQITISIVLFLRRLGYGGLVLLLTLSACSERPKLLRQWDDYQQRLANTQNVDTPDISLPAPERPPAVRDLRLDIPRVSLSLLDSMRLDACPAGALIAERNSALGRLTEGLSRYYGDIRLVEAMKQCIRQLEDAGASDLQNRLQQAVRDKSATMSDARQQAIATDDALRHALTPAGTPLASAAVESFAPALAALEIVVQVLEYRDQEDPLPNEEQLETALRTVAQSTYLPGFWRALHDQQAYLEQLTPLVDNLSQRAGCLSAGTPRRAEILKTIFMSFFADELQPLLAGFTTQAYQLAPVLQRLRDQSELAPMNVYLDQLQQLPTRLNRATRAHAQHWQTFFHDCDFTPGG